VKIGAAMKVPIPEDHGGRAAYLAERTTRLRDIQCRGELIHHAGRPACENRRTAARPPHTTPVKPGTRESQLQFNIVGTHGGAGTTTVARLLGAADAGRSWPDPSGLDLPPRVLLTARTNASGLVAASRALAGYCASDHPEGPFLAGFVLVPDAPGRLPKELNRRIAILASATMVYWLPWVRSWRLCEITPDQETAARLAPGLLQFATQAALATVPVPSPQRGCIHRRY
jgi:hypothetical protein